MPKPKESENTKHKMGVRSVESLKKKSDRNPSGPGDLSDCIDDIATEISSWVMGASRLFLRSWERNGKSRLLKKFFIILQSVVQSEEYKF